jgi:hypothetical protein
MADTFRSSRERVLPRTMLTRCTEPGCETLVLGGRCLEHEAPQTRIFVRGRPFVRSVMARSPTDVPGRAPVEARHALARATGNVLVGAARATVTD